MPQRDDSSPPSSQNVGDGLLSLATDFERSLTPIVDSSLAGLAEVAFVQGTMNPYDIRDVVVPPSTGHYLHVCLNVTTVRLQGHVTLELVTETGTVLTTESREVSFPRLTPRRPRPVGVTSLIFAVPAEVAWGDAIAAKLSLAT
jgi:hypothetical protein